MISDINAIPIPECITEIPCPKEMDNPTHEEVKTLLDSIDNRREWFNEMMAKQSLQNKMLLEDVESKFDELEVKLEKLKKYRIFYIAEKVNYITNKVIDVFLIVNTITKTAYLYFKEQVREATAIERISKNINMKNVTVLVSGITLSCLMYYIYKSQFMLI